MTRGMFRSRTFRQTSRKVPGGRLSDIFTKRTPKRATCAYCGKPLAGVPRKPLMKSASSRRPDRMYGGVLCSGCVREEIKLDARDE